MAQETPMTPEEYNDLVASIDWNAHTITGDEFADMRDAGAIVVDLRARDKFEASHIEGAINIPATDITTETMAKMVPDKTQTILIYCNNSFPLNEEELFVTRRLGLTISNLAEFKALGYSSVYQPDLFGLEEALAGGRLKMVQGSDP